MSEPFTIDPSIDPPFEDLPDEVKSVSLPPQIGLAAVALNYALKFADINTVQEGALYQQYKLEGKNMHGLCMDEVFHYAQQIEAWLLQSPSRLALVVLDAVAEDINAALDDEDASGMEAGTGETEGLDPKDDSPVAESETPDPISRTPKGGEA